LTVYVVISIILLSVFRSPLKDIYSPWNSLFWFCAGLCDWYKSERWCV